MSSKERVYRGGIKVMKLIAMGEVMDEFKEEKDEILERIWRDKEVWDDDQRKEFDEWGDRCTAAVLVEHRKIDEKYYEPGE